MFPAITLATTQVLAYEDLQSCALLQDDFYAAACKGDKAGKARVQNLQSRCVNNVHAAGKLLADVDVIRGIRMVVMATDPLSNDHSAIATQYKGIEGSRRFHCDRAHYGILVSMKELLASFRDLPNLELAGIKCTFVKDSYGYAFSHHAFTQLNT